MYIWVLLLCAALFVCLCVWERRTKRSFASLPSFASFPLLGSVHKIYGDGHLLFERLQEISEISEEKAKPFVIWFGLWPVLLLYDPDDVKLVTNTLIEKPNFYDIGRVWLGDGLVLASGEIWKKNIKKLAGTFSKSIVDGYQDIFNAQAQKLVQGLKREVGKAPFNVMEEYLAYTTLEAICQTALGVPHISESIVTADYYEAFNRTLELFIKRGMNPLLHPDCIYQLTPNSKELDKCVAVIHKVSETVICKRKKEREKKKSEQNVKQSSEEDRDCGFKSFLDILLELSDEETFSQEQIKAEVDTIIVGGQETVATTLYLALLMIGYHKDVQTKLYAEMQSIFGDSKRPVEKEDLTRMRYCEAIIYETLRLFPPIPVVLRYGDQDIQLKSLCVPKGTMFGVNIWGAGRSRRSWGPDALVFRPERWLQGDGGAGPGATFLPFSYGRRSCIGKRYANAIMKTILAYCIREFIFTSEADKLRFKIDVALKPTAGHLIQVYLR